MSLALFAGNTSTVMLPVSSAEMSWN